MLMALIQCFHIPRAAPERYRSELSSWYFPNACKSRIPVQRFCRKTLFHGDIPLPGSEYDSQTIQSNITERD
jgi:hypothetical protein